MFWLNKVSPTDVSKINTQVNKNNHDHLVSHELCWPIYIKLKVPVITRPNYTIDQIIGLKVNKVRVFKVDLHFNPFRTKRRYIAGSFVYEKDHVGNISTVVNCAKRTGRRFIAGGAFLIYNSNNMYLYSMSVLL